MSNNEDFNKAPNHYKDILPEDVNNYLKKRVEELENDLENAKKEASAYFKKLSYKEISYLRSRL